MRRVVVFDDGVVLQVLPGVVDQGRVADRRCGKTAVSVAAV